MTEVLATFDSGLATNPYVRILKRGGGRIALTPLEKQEDPVGLTALKTEIGRRWPMTSLLDMLKEADLRIGFTSAFRTVTDHENLSRAALQERLLLCLNRIGTNTGLKRMAAGQDDVTYRDLLYVRRRFITRESMREAIAQVVNATLRARHPGIWGEGTTASKSTACSAAVLNANDSRFPMAGWVGDRFQRVGRDSLGESKMQQFADFQCRTRNR